MKKMSLNTIRSKFLDFFDRHDHLVQPSYPLVPLSDKSLLLINAGMVPFKDFFTGKIAPPSVRMVTCQKCIRTNDIENVGITSRHASFFEMLGNFSFGDYFKSQAIKLAWQFITEDLGLDKDKLWVTVYLEDDEAYNLWHKQENVPTDRIVRLGKEDNFWEIGSGTGPCGPCSEIYYDRGAKYGCGCSDCKPGCECDRFVEFWNLVFTQFNQTEDGQYIPLENPNIDTGMGIERIACLIQDVESIFDVDTMVTIRDHVTKMADAVYGVNDKHDISIRKITDHIRAVTFLVGDGVLPNNEGRGYVLRRLLRRAARHGRLIGIEGAFLHKLCDTVIETFGQAYPDLVERQAYIKKVIAVEEERFAQTIDGGLNILESYIEDLNASNQKILNGARAFKLYDTYGFPLDLTLEILAERGIDVDQSGFESEMNAQRERARASRGSGSAGWSSEDAIDFSAYQTKFVGYTDKLSQTKVLALVKDNQLVDTISGESACLVLLEKTPFYAESGGQTGDTGLIYSDGAKLIVNDAKKNATGSYLHYAQLLEGELSVGDNVTAEVSAEKRLSIARNHTATHLLHRALKDVLGDHVEQAGSLVEVDRLRFDFTHFSPMSDEEVKRVDDVVNDKILSALPVCVEEMPIDDARQKGAMALFGEKYGDVVRVVTMGDYSIELCGGTHLDNTAQVGLFKLISETGIAAGVRRIEAITGRAVNTLINEQLTQQEKLAKLLKVSRDDVISKVTTLIDENRDLQKSIEKSKQQAANNAFDDLNSNAERINNIRVIKGHFNDQSADTLRNLADQLVENTEPTLVVLANVVKSKVNFIAMANDGAVQAGAHCGNIVREMAKICGGGGGGRPNMAQAGGKDVTKLSEALQILPKML